VLDIVNFGKIVSYHHIIYTVRGQDNQDVLNRAVCCSGISDRREDVIGAFEIVLLLF
jgi:hypothetical protein